MNKRDLKVKIFRSLKTGNRTIDEIQIDVGRSVSKKDISACLDMIIKDGWVERVGREYQIIHILGKPIDIAKRETDWNYETLQEVQGATKEKPEQWKNPFAEVVPHVDQGNRGTCCGFAGKNAAWLTQLRLLDPSPDPIKVNRIEYDVITRVFDQCNMIVDLQHELSPSAQGLYAKCREIENVSYPSGCWIRGIVRAWKDWGYNYEKDWMTSKNTTCVPKYYPLVGTEEETVKFLEEQGKLHRIEGYAQALSWDALQDAIYNYGCALIAINIYENVTANNKAEKLPEPDGDPIGSHALCAFGYDTGKIYFLHSWRSGWPKVGSISRNYYNKACGPAYIAIDSVDVGIAQDIYGTVIVTTNVPCDIWINKDVYQGTEVKSSIQLYKDYTIIASPVDPDAVVEKEMRRDIHPTKEEPDFVITFVFQEKEDPYSWIKEFIKSIFDKIFNRA